MMKKLLCFFQTSGDYNGNLGEGNKVLSFANIKAENGRKSSRELFLFKWFFQNQHRDCSIHDEFTFERIFVGMRDL